MNLTEDNFKYFPSSWYPVLLSTELRLNEHKEIKAFNTELTIFRGADHQVGAIFPICPHMGTRFRAGKVCGNNIVCPLHLREFDKHGLCVKIPKSKDIPKNAHNIALPVHEFAGIIFVFLGNEKVFPFPEFNRAKSEIVFSKPANYFLKTPYQALIFNGFDTHHLGCIHSREILTEPIFKKSNEKITAEYKMGVLINSWYDKVVKVISGTEKDALLEVFGGNFMIITIKSTKDNILIASLPITYSTSRIFLTSMSDKEKGLWKYVFQIIRLKITTFLGVSFLRPDIKIIEDMRPDFRNFLGTQDKGAGVFWDYWDGLERDRELQDKLRDN